jgi:hypothetical protein
MTKGRSTADAFTVTTTKMDARIIEVAAFATGQERQPELKEVLPK